MLMTVIHLILLGRCFIFSTYKIITYEINDYIYYYKLYSFCDLKCFFEVKVGKKEKV